MKIEKLSLKEKIGQMLMFAFHGLDYNEQLEVFKNEFSLGSVVLFARNIKDVVQVSRLNSAIQKDSKIPMFISLDQEGGTVLRVMSGITALPGAMTLASTNRDEVYQITKAVAKDLVNLGFNMNFAPVGDVNNNPNNPVINSRSYSDNPKVVADLSEDAFKGFQDGGLLPTIKHFPGHGNTSVDSHLGLPIVTDSYSDIMKTEIVPFKNAIDKGIDGVMMSHIVYEVFDSKYPASLSKKIINDFLIEKLNFKGLVVTDSLTMGAISKHFTFEEVIYNGVMAGNDILVFCGKASVEEQRFIYNTFYKLVEEGKIPIERIDFSVNKILKLKAKYTKSRPNLQMINLKENNELSRRLYDQSTTIVKDGGLIPITDKDNVLSLFPKINLFSFIDNDKQKYDTLSRYLKIDEKIYNSENYLDILKDIDSYNKIILFTYNVQEDDYQSKLFNSLDKSRVIVVSLRSPYDLLKLEGCKNYICTYEPTIEALESLSRVLMGKQKAVGKLPINL